MNWDTYCIQPKNAWSGVCYRYNLMLNHQSTFDRPNIFTKAGGHSWAMKIVVL